MFMKLHFVIMFLAVIRVRATAAPLNAAYTAEEYELYLSDSESKLLLTPQEGNSCAQAAAAKLNIPHTTAALPGADSELALTLQESDLNLLAHLLNEQPRLRYSSTPPAPPGYVTKGYKNNPEATRVAFQFGGFHTGDLGYLDSDGYLHLVGRIKELINRGGEKISPIEVNAVLLSHPDISQAVAFGVPDDKYGEEINCAIIPREGSNTDEAEVLRYCKTNLAAFEVPKKVFITDALPKTASGKIQRGLVAEHFIAQISTAKVPKFGA